MKISSIGVKVTRRIPMETYGSAGAEYSIWVEFTSPEETEHLDEISRALWRTATENVRGQIAVFRQQSYEAAEAVYMGLPEEVRKKFPAPKIPDDIIIETEPDENADTETTEETDISDNPDELSPQQEAN